MASQSVKPVKPSTAVDLESDWEVEERAPVRHHTRHASMDAAIQAGRFNLISGKEMAKLHSAAETMKL
jgi:hypothetical protein